MDRRTSRDGCRDRRAAGALRHGGNRGVRALRRGYFRRDHHGRPAGGPQAPRQQRARRHDGRFCRRADRRSCVRERARARRWHARAGVGCRLRPAGPRRGCPISPEIRTMNDRMPPLAPEAMSEEQRAAAAELTAGPRGGVRGPFIALLRSPELMRRLQKVGEYLRYQSALERRLGEFAMLIVSRHLTQHFEWHVHYPLAIEAGLAKETADALPRGARPRAMREDEATVYDFCSELLQIHGVAEDTYC